MRFFLVALLLGWSLAGAAQEPPPMRISVERFDVVGENPLSPAVTEQTLSPFLGEYSELAGLMAAVDALEQALKVAGHSFHRVSIQPTPQGAPPTTVQLKVLALDLGKVTVRGNRHYSIQSVRRSLPALAGESMPSTHELSRQLTVANLHPRKRATVNFRQGDEPDRLDATISVEDRRPWSVFGNINNIGNEATGYSRLLVGGQYANLSGFDDVLTATVTTSPDNANDVFQFGAFYQLPIYVLKGWLSAFHVRSDVDVGNVNDVFDVTGSGQFTGLAFRRQLLSVGRYRHSFNVGLQDRLFDNEVSITGQLLFGAGLTGKVRSRPLSLRYDGSYNWLRTRTSLDFYGDFTRNLDFGGHNDRADYVFVRPGADPNWKLLRFGALATQQLPRGYSVVLRLTGQYSAEALIPGEQIGVGGERSVRGFEERSVAGDQGLIGNLEFWSPPIDALRGLRLLGFLDGGYKKIVDPVAGQRPNDTLASVGVGARWQWLDQLQFALDYGLPVAHGDGEASDRGNSKWHVSLSYRY
jgi:hemolysin activation/secretion protein